MAANKVTILPKDMQGHNADYIAFLVLMYIGKKMRAYIYIYIPNSVLSSYSNVLVAK